ncbi:hypothetical protein HMPREF0185_03031 [Brevundimonas diminuta 470-4]|nr:hypothetical protein HMPREF0185_03031 [Brevundimonas diminuta 470-4]
MSFARGRESRLAGPKWRLLGITSARIGILQCGNLDWPTPCPR